MTSKRCFHIDILLVNCNLLLPLWFYFTYCLRFSYNLVTMRISHKQPDWVATHFLLALCSIFFFFFNFLWFFFNPSSLAFSCVCLCVCMCLCVRIIGWIISGLDLYSVTSQGLVDKSVAWSVWTAITDTIDWVASPEKLFLTVLEAGKAKIKSLLLV